MLRRHADEFHGAIFALLPPVQLFDPCPAVLGKPRLETERNPKEWIARRGKAGVIVRDHGVYTFPDTNAHGQGEKRQHVYSVRFSARELWGDSASPRDSVHLDLWDDYLERA